MTTTNKCKMVAAVCLTVACLLAAPGVRAEDQAAGSPYQDDPAIVEKIKALQPGHALLLPTTKFLKDGQPTDGSGRNGPYARDYTTMMVYAPERRSALYAGGNHGMGRTNDVWEYHLGSNTWHQLHDDDGGDHARFKFTLMFYARVKGKNPNPELKDNQKKEIEACKKWWLENVTLQDGLYRMKNTGAPLLVGHTWDTLMYDPVNKRMVQGTGAYCAASTFLQSEFTGQPEAEIKAGYGKNAEGVPYRAPWTFDPIAKKWQPYAHSNELAHLRGMGGSLLYISDLKSAVWYYAGQNTSNAKHIMLQWDLEKDTWTDMKPNGGASLFELGPRKKVAPEAEQQMVYAPEHKKIFAVLKSNTHVYDFATNEWSRLNETVPFMAHDAKTVLGYDPKAKALLLVDPRNCKMAAYDIKTNTWEMIEAEGGQLKKPPYCVGKGYFDPTYNVMVVQSASMQNMWVYRHKAKSQ